MHSSSDSIMQSFQCTTYFKQKPKQANLNNNIVLFRDAVK